MARSLPQARRSWRRLLGAALLILVLAAALPRYATAEPPAAQPAPADPAPLQPVLLVVPSDDGQSVLVRAGGLGRLSGRVSTNLRLGPSGNKGSYTMVYSDTAGLYEALVPGFPAGQSQSATVEISTTAGLRSAELSLARAYLPAGQPGVVATDDGLLLLTLPNAGTLPGSPYVAAHPSPAPPGPPPAGLRLVGSSYGVRASGSIAQGDKPMALRLGFLPAELGAADPESLALYAWEPQARAWSRVGGNVFADERYVSAAITRFTYYALMVPSPVTPKEQVFLPLLRS